MSQLLPVSTRHLQLSAKIALIATIRSDHPKNWEPRRPFGTRAEPISQHHECIKL